MVFKLFGHRTRRRSRRRRGGGGEVEEEEEETVNETESDMAEEGDKVTTSEMIRVFRKWLSE